MKLLRLIGLVFGVFALFGALVPGATARQAADDADPVSIYRVYVDSQAAIDSLVNDGVFDLLENRGEDYLLVIGEAEVQTALEAEGFRVEVERRLEPLDGVNGDDARARFGQVVSYFGGYRTVDEHYAHLNEVEASYPGLARVVDYGDSWRAINGVPGGNDLLAICLTNRQAGDCALNPDSDKPRAMIVAAVHARELQTSEVAWRLIDELTTKYGSDADVTHIMDTTEVWIVPVVNPDGREIVEGGGNSPYLQRKNANDNLGNCSVPPSSFNQHGVDLNRNASYQWGGVGTTTNPCAQTYRGTSPASEPEQAALEALFRQLWPDQKGGVASPVGSDAVGSFITMHSFGDLILLPPGAGGLTPNDAELRAFAFRMSHYNGYRTGTGPEILYGVTGSTDDWVYGQLGVAAFTYELSPGGGACSGFTPAYSCVDSVLWPLNRDALLYSLKVASAPYVTPRGPTTTSIAATASVAQGETLTLNAAVNDNALGNAAGSVNRPTPVDVTDAEYYIDASPLQGGTPIAMTAVDGSFNERNEDVRATVATGSLSVGEHTLFVRGRNAAGFWGPVTATTFTVTPGVSDTTPPSTAVSSPTPGEDIALNPFAITGTTTDNVGVERVQVAVVDRDTGNFLQADGTLAPGRSFTNATLASPGAGSTTWSLPVDLPDGRYRLIAKANDAAGNNEGAVRFGFDVVTSVDSTAPSTSVTAPTAGAVVTEPSFDVTGTSTDNIGVARVRVAVVDRSTGQFLQADGSFAASRSFIEATLANPGGVSTAWSLPISLDDGSYRAIVKANDGSGNVESPVRFGFSVDAA